MELASTSPLPQTFPHAKAWRLTTRRILPALLALCLVYGLLFSGHARAPRVSEGHILERISRPAVGAHRGGSWSPANNTLHRFQEALAAGADILECDLQLTADGVPVVYHDPTLPRLVGTGPRIDELTLEELKKHRVLRLYEIPTFEEVLDWCKGRAVINAEFKTVDVVLPAVDLVKQYDAYEWVYFQTKSDPGRYRIAREHDAQVALLFKPEDDAGLDWALGLNDDRLVVIEIGENMLRPEVLEKVHAAGKVASYNAWRRTPFQEFFRANAPEIWDLGVDIAITKRPASAVRQRDAWMAEGKAP